ncbi:hypothetical protein C8F01DRAFT_1275964 [Mycena amicta]|nr:hypothetical protein C8F01DRAFT_1275964 [Mycena amicta]
MIADYPEQVLLAGIVQGWCPRCTALAHDLDGPIGTRRSQELAEHHIKTFDGDPKTLWDNYGINTDVIPFTNDFPRADIHEMLSPDLLHQLIKGTFKDHLVEWVCEYLYLKHEKKEADEILDEIDRRIAAVPSFPGLRHFKQGRQFSQWTGDDLKALMKVYLPALKDLVPPQIVQALSSFLDFCYLVRRHDFNQSTLDAINTALEKYHELREVFGKLDVRPDGFSLPRQHSMKHYASEIKQFGAPNGLCSSITESRHITAVKKPWRRSNRFEALGQMLLTNQRLDKLAASRADFEERGMLPRQHVALPDQVLRRVLVDVDEEAVDGPRVDGTVVLARTRERSYPRSATMLGNHISVPQFSDLLVAYLDDQPTGIDSDADDMSEPDDVADIELSVFHSAIATFFAPSDLSGIRGMKREWIHCTPSWRKHGPRRDCAFVVEKEDVDGFRGMSAVRTKLFFSFRFNGVYHPCALVEWFKKVGQRPDPETGMWIVEKEMEGRRRLTTIVPLNTMLRGAHLIPVFALHTLTTAKVIVPVKTTAVVVKPTVPAKTTAKDILLSSPTSLSVPVVPPVLPTTSLPLSPSSPILPSSSSTLPTTSSVLPSSSTTSLPAATKSPAVKSAPKSSSSPSPSTRPSSAASVSSIAAAIVSSIAGLTIAGLLVAFVLRRWNRQRQAQDRESIVDFDAKAFRRSAHLLDDPSSPLPLPNPHFTSTGTGASMHSVYSGQSAHTTVAAYTPYPYHDGAGLNASVTPAVAVASPVTVMHTHNTHPSFTQPPPAKYYGYSSGTPVPSPGSGYAPAPMQMMSQGYAAPGYVPSVHSMHSMHSVQSQPQPYGGYPPEMHRQPQQPQNVNRFSPPSQMVQMQNTRATTSNSIIARMMFELFFRVAFT